MHFSLEVMLKLEEGKLFKIMSVFNFCDDRIFFQAFTSLVFEIWNDWKKILTTTYFDSTLWSEDIR